MRADPNTIHPMAQHSQMKPIARKLFTVGQGAQQKAFHRHPTEIRRPSKLLRSFGREARAWARAKLCGLRPKLTALTACRKVAHLDDARSEPESSLRSAPSDAVLGDRPRSRWIHRLSLLALAGILGRWRGPRQRDYGADRQGSINLNEVFVRRPAVFDPLLHSRQVVPFQSSAFLSIQLFRLRNRRGGRLPDAAQTD